MGREFGSAFQVQGLEALARDLAATDAELKSSIKAAGLKAAEVIEKAAEAKAEQVGPQAARAAEALSVSVGFGYASVNLTEDDAHPFALGAEFGAKHDIPRTVGVRKVRENYTVKEGKHGSRTRSRVAFTDARNAHTIIGWNQFKDWRGNQSTDEGDDGVGYFLHPAARDMTPLIGEAYLAEVEAAFLANGFTAT